MAGILKDDGTSADAPKQAVYLPPLREDLKLLPGAPTRDGEPTWTLHDPAQHRFLRIGWLEFEILSRWGLANAEQIAQGVSSQTSLKASENDVMEVLRFAYNAGLLMPVGQNGAEQLMAQANGGKSSAGQWLLKNYIFFRVRLFNPDRLLDSLYQKLSWMFTKRFVMIIGALGLLGFYLILRQWQSYTHSFLHLFSLEGAFEVGIALSFAKIIHELGHGLMTKRFGCRVPAMGAAFIVLWPVLWTDTTDAWRLTDRKKRIAIDAAGMLAEITLAVIASLAWSVLPEGAPRTAAFLLSSSTWIITVTVNLNPLMRFDGYYLLSDILDVPNLQERSFALCRWYLREHLFGLGEPAPEEFPKRLKYILLSYGFGCWIYRFFLFLGIALLVYHLAFKALGILLMAVEIWWFIARPILQEFHIWGGRLKGTSLNRQQRRSLKLLALALFIMVIPLRAHIVAAGILRAERQAVIYTPEPGQLVSIAENGAQVEKDAPILTLDSPHITYQLAKASAEVVGLKTRLSGQSFDPQRVANLEVSRKEYESATARQQSLKTQAASLIVHAPFSGIMTDVPHSLRTGEWLPRREPLGMLIAPETQLAEAYVNEADLGRIQVGDTATFYPDNGEASLALTIADISTASVANLDVPELASINGGAVGVRKEQNGRIVPEVSLYRVLLKPVKELPNFTHRQRGSVEIAGSRISILGRLYQRTMAVMIRETGF